jgi:hypothetical protein
MGFNQEVQDNAITQAELLESTLDSAISDLKTAASGYFQPSLSQAGFDNNPTWGVDRGREVTLSGLNDLPADRPTLTVPTFSYNPEDLFPPDLTQRYGYDSDFFDNFLDERLRDYIDTPTQFISEDVQDAIFDQTRDRDLRTLQDAMDAVDRQFASQRGFPTVTDAQNTARLETTHNYTNTKNDRNKEETALIAERAQRDKEHSIDAGIKMEDIRSRFQLESANLYWRASDYLIRKFEADVRAEITRFNGELDLLKADTSVKQGMADKDLQYESLDQEKERARLQASFEELRGNVQTWMRSFDGRIKAAGQAVSHYSAEVNGWLSQTNAINYEDTST